MGEVFSTATGSALEDVMALTQSHSLVMNKSVQVGFVCVCVCVCVCVLSWEELL